MTAKFTWQPAYPGEPAPTSVIVCQQASSSVYCQSQSAASTGVVVGGSCADGLGGSKSGCPSYISTTQYKAATPGGDGSVMLNCSPGATFTVNTGTGSAAGNASASYNASVSPVTISLSGTLTNSSSGQPVLDGSGNQQILVGQGCTATVVGLPSIPGATVSYTWTVPGNRVQNFVISSDQTTGTATPFTSPNAVSAHWYWSDKPAIETVSCTVNVTFPAGQGASFSITPTKQISLQAPTPNVFVTPGAVQLNGINSGTYGAAYDLYLGPPPGTSTGQGIAWTGNISQPLAFSGQGPGLWHFTQIITPTRSRTKPKGVAEPSSNNGKSGLDKVDPYGNAAYFADNSQHTNGDSPGFALSDTYSNYQVTETFQTYVMYQPPAASGGDRILVPLYEIDWNWGANVTIVNSSWANFGTNDVGGKLAVTSQQIQTQHPSWKMLITSPPVW